MAGLISNSIIGVVIAWFREFVGGIAATQELVDLCHIDANKYVLDVGCGVGVTPCYIVKKVWL